MMRFLTAGGFVLVVVVVFGGLSTADSARVSNPGICTAASITDAILGFRDSVCDLHHGGDLYDLAVIEGDEMSLQKALHMVYSLGQDYVAVLFYASWCPFSRNFRPSFSILSSLYPSIPHFAVQESAIRPSTLSKYGVRGFPTLLLLNSTMRVRYRGSRSLNSLVAFYSDVTGIKSDARGQLALERFKGVSNHEGNNDNEPENCPFSWARSPENMFRQETYLALATIFVLLRLLYFVFPNLSAFAHCTRTRYMRHVRIGRLWEHPMCYLNKAKQLVHSMRKDPCKGTNNFQEGAINAKTWASKSLASAVAIGDASTSRGASVSATH